MGAPGGMRAAERPADPLPFPLDYCTQDPIGQRLKTRLMRLDL